MSKYESMSDFEINKLVAEARGVCFYYFDKDGHRVNCKAWDSFDEFDKALSGELPDYCNSWADMGPVIQSEGILISPLVQYDEEGFDKWVALKPHHVGNEEITNAPFESVVHARPLRAAAIIYLESLESANA